MKKALVRFRTRLQNGEYDNLEQLAPLLAPNEMDYIEEHIRMEEAEQEQCREKEREKRLEKAACETCYLGEYCNRVSCMRQL